MAGTRSSARLAANQSSSPQSAKNEAGSKRKADASPASAKSKRGKKGDGQMTLEQTGVETEETKQKNETNDEETRDDTNKDVEDTKQVEETKDTEMKDDDTNGDAQIGGELSLMRTNAHGSARRC